MPLYKWALHLLFFASVLGSGIGFAVYFQTHYSVAPEVVHVNDVRKNGDSHVSSKDNGPRSGSVRDLDGDLAVVVLATRLLDESDSELETQLRSFLSLTSARLLGGNVRVVGKSGTATWPAADATGKLWNLVEGFKRDECDLAFAALFSEMQALRARATGPRFHTIVLWKCDLSPDSVPETAGSPEPPGAASMSLFWLSDPEYPRSIIPARFTRWFGKSITSVGTEVQGLSNSLVNVASRYPLR